MNIMNRFMSMGLLGIALTLSGNMGHTYAYNLFTTSTGEGIFAVNPFVYAPTLSPFSLGTDPLIAYGITPSLDIFVDLANLSISPAFAYNFSYGMIRYDFGGNNIIVLQASQTFVSPQYHFFYENEMFAAEANIYATFNYSSFSTPLVGAYLAPVLKLVKDTFSFYVEIDPSYAVSTNSTFALNIVPGVWIGLGGAGQLSIACLLNNVTGTITPGVGVWYWLTFDTKGK